MSNLKLNSMQIVTQGLTIIGVANERSVGLEANHLDMAKLEDPGNVGYQSIIEFIEQADGLGNPQEEYL